MNSREIALSSICAALYALVGYLTYLGLFTPAIGVVRFWPPVFIPAVFSIAFSPLIGGLGAAVGIFISDMIIHGNALLSLSVGVPSNFTAFYIIGYLYRITRKRFRISLFASFLLQIVFLLLIYEVMRLELLSWEIGSVYLIAMAITFLIIAVYTAIFKKYSREDIAIVFSSSTGLLVGSIIIGLGVWVFSQAFILPTGERNLPLEAALLWMLWVYVTEIPFLISLTPFFVSLVKKVFGEIK